MATRNSNLALILLRRPDFDSYARECVERLLQGAWRSHRKAFSIRGLVEIEIQISRVSKAVEAPDKSAPTPIDFI